MQASSCSWSLQDYKTSAYRWFCILIRTGISSANTVKYAMNGDRTGIKRWKMSSNLINPDVHWAQYKGIWSLLELLILRMAPNQARSKNQHFPYANSQDPGQPALLRRLSRVFAVSWNFKFCIIKDWKFWQIAWILGIEAKVEILVSLVSEKGGFLFMARDNDTKL